LVLEFFNYRIPDGTMVYTEAYQRARMSIQERCKALIIVEWEQLFTQWLSTEASADIGTIYKRSFQEHFGSFLDAHLEKQLWLSGTSLVAGLYTFLEIHDGVLELDDMLRFMRLFIDHQLDAFNIWSYELRESVDGVVKN